MERKEVKTKGDKAVTDYVAGYDQGFSAGIEAAIASYQKLKRKYLWLWWVAAMAVFVLVAVFIIWPIVEVRLP